MYFLYLTAQGDDAIGISSKGLPNLDIHILAQRRGSLMAMEHNGMTIQCILWVGFIYSDVRQPFCEWELTPVQGLGVASKRFQKPLALTLREGITYLAFPVGIGNVLPEMVDQLQ